MKKIGLLAMLLIFALGSLGVGYAHWSETLTISGVVEMGDIDPQFGCVCTNDDDEDDPTGCGSWTKGCNWTGTRRTQDVGDTTASKDGQLLEIEVTNAYPCYYGSTYFEIINFGTVSANLVGLKLVRVSGPWLGNWWPKDVTLVSCTWYYVDADTGWVSTTPWADYDFALHLSELVVPTKVEANEGEIWGDLCIHMGEGAEEFGEYDFTVELIFNNWPY